MTVLAFDTSTDTGSVALLADGKLLAERTFARAAKEDLFPVLQEIGASQFDEIAVGVGPGSFTGIRAGIAAAKGLALPGRLPVRGVSSFDALALTAASGMPADCALMCVLADARRGEICYRLYDRAAQPAQEYRLGPVEDLADAVHDPIWFVSAEIGRYAEAIRSCLGGFAVVSPTPHFPSAAAVGRLVAERGTTELVPIYLRATEYRKQQ